MSKLDELIKELCPDGVQLLPLEKCCYIHDRLRKPITKSLRESGYYPYYGANGIQDYVKEFIFDGTFVLVGEDGSVMTQNGNPVVTWAEGKIWVNNHAHIISAKDNTLLRYLYHYIQTINIRALIHGNIPKLTGKDFRNLMIPIPPMPIQEEIVKILDTFSALSQELSQELSLRQKQYEYYRDYLLSEEILEKLSVSNSLIKHISISEFANVSSGGTPNRKNESYFKGFIPWLRTQEVDFNLIEDTGIKITDEAYNSCSAKMIPANCVIVAMYGATAGKCAVNKIPLCTNQACCNLEINSDIAIYKYIYYYLESKYIQIKAMGQGSQGNLNAKQVKGIVIPIPPLSVQQQIVDILDKFSALCTSITDGLPAEIEARQKQYEYYRDKLLSFETH